MVKKTNKKRFSMSFNEKEMKILNRLLYQEEKHDRKSMQKSTPELKKLSKKIWKKIR